MRVCTIEVQVKVCAKFCFDPFRFVLECDCEGNGRDVDLGSASRLGHIYFGKIVQCLRRSTLEIIFSQSSLTARKNVLDVGCSGLR
jgi:hypothetical protein